MGNVSLVKSGEELMQGSVSMACGMDFGIFVYLLNVYSIRESRTV